MREKIENNIYTNYGENGVFALVDKMDEGMCVHIDNFGTSQR
jgi:hypothetical protein